MLGLKKLLRKAGCRRLGRRGSVAVEFAMASTFVLLPLFAGGADVVELLSAQAQLNTTLQSLYYFAYTNPGSADTAADLTAVVTAINNNATHQISTTITHTPSTSCIDSTGNTVTCASGTTTKETFETYTITCPISLTVPLTVFGFSNSLSATGTVQVNFAAD